MTNLRDSSGKSELLDCQQAGPRIVVDSAVWLRAARESSKGEGDLVAL